MDSEVKGDFFFFGQENFPPLHSFKIQLGVDMSGQKLTCTGELAGS
jgi:hypothetical protein